MLQHDADEVTVKEHVSLIEPLRPFIDSSIKDQRHSLTLAFDTESPAPLTRMVVLM